MFFDNRKQIFTNKLRQRPQVEKVLDDVFTAHMNIRATQLQEHYNTFGESKAFNDIILLSKAFELVEFWDLELFSSVYKIFSTFETIGSFNGLVMVIKAFLGDEIMLEFAEAGAGEIIINISNTGNTSLDWETADNQGVTTADNRQIQAVSNRLITSDDNVIKLIKLFIPLGVKTTININAEV